MIPGDHELDRDEDARRILRRAPSSLSVPPFAHVEMRAQRRSPFGLMLAGAALLVLGLVIGSTLSERRADVAQPSSAPTASTVGATPNASSTLPEASLSRNAGLVLASSPGVAFMRETDGAAVGNLNAALFAVSPDGTRVAYFAGAGFDELWVAEVARLDRPQRVLSLGSNFAGGLVWSTDGMGILFSSQSRARVPGPGGEPVESSLEGLHLDPRQGDVRERFATQSNLSIRPLLWVREPKLVAGVTPAGQKGPGGYIVISGGRAAFWSSLPDALQNDPSVGWPVASSDGRWVASVYRYGLRDTRIRVWPSDDPTQVTELADVPFREIGSARWRPATLDLIVEIGGQLEVWNREGAKRLVGDLRGPISALRWDGSAVYTEPDGRPELIEIETGRRALLPNSFARPAGSPGSRILTSVRLE